MRWCSLAVIIDQWPWYLPRWKPIETREQLSPKPLCLSSRLLRVLYVCCDCEWNRALSVVFLQLIHLLLNDDLWCRVNV